MELLQICNLKTFPIAFPIPPQISRFRTVSRSSFNLSPPFHNISTKSYIIRARKKNSQPEPVLKPTIVDEVSEDEEDELFDDFEDEEFIDGDDEDFEDNEEDYSEDEAELYNGDGAGGGGISLAGTRWDKEALSLAEEVIQSFDGDLGIYAFKTLPNSSIRVRIEKLSNRSGAPPMEDIEAFSKAYRERLDKAEIGKTIPENIYFEVSSPGLERAVRIPEDLERFKDRPMYVRYVNEVGASESSSVLDGVLKLVAYDLEMETCTWGLADVKINRAKNGKGRPLNKKQREWRITTSFGSLRLVRLHFEQ